MPGTNCQINLRQFPRIDMRGRAVLFFGKDSEVTEMLQVSEGGMMAFTKLRMQVGDQLTIHFSIAEKFLRARAEIIYIIPVEMDGRYKIGLRFKSLFEEYRSAIREFVN